jgi:hypothetical protein
MRKLQNWRKKEEGSYRLPTDAIRAVSVNTIAPQNSTRPRLSAA